MARVNIYLPDETARRARDAGLNVSAVCRRAVERELGRSAMADWLASLDPAPAGFRADTLRALDEARAELWGEPVPAGPDPGAGG